MSCGAIFDMINDDPEMVGCDVFSDYTAEDVSRESFTVILRWGAQDFQRSVLTGPRDLDVWVHQPKEIGTDYTAINEILDTIDEIMSRAGGEQGADRVKVTLVDKIGSSRNLEDPGFDTFCRYNSYRVLARKMV